MIGGRQTAKRERKRNHRQKKDPFVLSHQKITFIAHILHTLIHLGLLSVRCSLREKKWITSYAVFCCFLFSVSVKMRAHTPIENATNRTNATHFIIIFIFMHVVLIIIIHNIQIWRENLTRFKFKRYWNYYQTAKYMCMPWESLSRAHTTKNTNQLNWKERRKTKMRTNTPRPSSHLVMGKVTHDEMS